MLLAYYLKSGVSFESAYSRKALREDENIDYPILYWALRYKNNKAFVRELRKESKQVRIGDLLLEIGQNSSRWDMVFILEDHVCRWSRLHLAVLREDTEQIASLLQADPRRLEQPDARGRTPLALAAAYQCDKSYHALMTFNPDLDAPDRLGNTPLMQAAAYGNAVMVKDLIERGARLSGPADSHCAPALEKIATAATAVEELDTTIRRNGIKLLFQKFKTEEENIEKTREILTQSAHQSGLALTCDDPAAQ